MVGFFVTKSRGLKRPDGKEISQVRPGFLHHK